MLDSGRSVSQARPFRAAILALALALGPAAAGAAQDYGLTTQRVVVDPLSGIALFGYDPVAYFVDGKPVPGSPDHEWRWSGATWRFASAANKAEFQRAPESFAPAYGGYDADAVLRRSPVAADPSVFAVRDERLFLFRSPEARDAFFATGGPAAADQIWPGLLAELSP
ncbi:hypothetical protein SLNSH_00560 [Alsobacter soli]|uniref:YHS domain-containing protein n=1 Tax=Alsobacter soli TaxID=2109933 RepID=A0A2T1HZQ0_9HYPH|nr:hypothetical protein SLNSH_00560 [Alsobacter soli]